MLRSKRSEILAASMLMAPFVITYGVLFIYPTIKMAQLSLTNAPLIGPGKWVGFDNYVRLASDRLFSVAIWNTLYFVVLSVIPSTLLGLVVALGVNRLKGWLQSVVLAAFFLPYVLPVSVVFRIWQWMCDKDFGVAQHVVQLFNDGRAPLDLPDDPAVHAGGRHRDDLVAHRFQRSSVHRRIAQHLE